MNLTEDLTEILFVTQMALTARADAGASVANDTMLPNFSFILKLLTGL